MTGLGSFGNGTWIWAMADVLFWSIEQSICKWVCLSVKKCLFSWIKRSVVGRPLKDEGLEIIGPLLYNWWSNDWYLSHCPILVYHCFLQHGSCLTAMRSKWPVVLRFCSVVTFGTLLFVNILSRNSFPTPKAFHISSVNLPLCDSSFGVSLARP